MTSDPDLTTIEPRQHRAVAFESRNRTTLQACLLATIADYRAAGARHGVLWRLQQRGVWQSAPWATRQS